MKKNLMYTVLILTVFALIFVLAIPKKEKSEKSQTLTKSHPARTGGLTANKTLYDFGEISMKNGLASTMFTITNQSDTEMMIEKLQTSCMCTDAYIVSGEKERGPFGMPGHGGSVPKANEKIPAGESRNIKVVYDPNAHGPAGVGKINRLVYVTDENGRTIELEIQAVVRP